MNRSRTTFAGCGSALALLGLLAACDRAPAPPAAAPPPRAELSVHDAWARPADSGATTAAYFVLVNAGRAADTLTGVRTADAGESGLHMSMQQGATMHMAPVGSLPAPAADSVRFAPMGAHVMLLRTRRALVAGDTVAFTLTFASGESLAVRAGVRAP